MPLPDDFPLYMGPARDAAILAAARAGILEFGWSEITTSHGSHTATFRVTSDGVKLGGVRLAGSAALCHQVADIVAASLGTPRLNDEAWLQADVRIPPQTIAAKQDAQGRWVVDNTTAGMVRHSALIDAAINRIAPAPVATQGDDVGSALSPGLVMPIGKPWCLAKDLSTGKGALYGWQSNAPVAGIALRKSPATPGVFVVQPFSTEAHASSYEDYSSSLWFVARQCVVDGAQMDLWTLLRSPDLAQLASHEGVL
jgi:hypothetical protein